MKYLAQLGWRVRVLTGDPRFYEPVAFDPTLLGEIGPTVELHRARPLLPAGPLGYGLLVDATGGRHPSRLSRALLPVARWVQQVLMIPDDKILWSPAALARGLRLLRDQPADIVFASAPPHSTLVIALALSRLTRTPLVVDFRDDWIGNPLYFRSSRARAFIERLLERAVVKSARAVLVPTPASRTQLAARYPELSHRIRVVPNGFDPSDIPRYPLKAVRTDRLVCYYAGLLNERRELGGLLKAIRRIHMRQPRTIELRLAGFVPLQTRDAIARLGEHVDVTLLGYLPHAQAVAETVAADVAVIVSTYEEGAATAVPSKLYEYVACRTPVLGLVDRGATCELIHGNRWGITCPPRDAQAIEQALLELWRRKRNGTLGLDSDALERVRPFSRQVQAQAVSGILAMLLRD